jgi:RNA polymerase sigma-70 factor (ECF subfamily)
MGLPPTSRIAGRCRLCRQPLVCEPHPPAAPRNELPASPVYSMNDDIADLAERRRFDALCTPLSADLVRFVYWLCRDRMLAEDVVQETLLRAWRSLDSLRDESAARPWLLTIARRELARVFERKRVHVLEIECVDDLQNDATAGQDDYQVDETRRAIFELELLYREPLVLQVLFGYSTKEIARHLEINVATVLTRLYRARQLLRARLQPQSAEMKVRE